MITTIGFTGTRKGLTPVQRQKLHLVLAKLKPKKFIFGDCVGADAEAFDVVSALDQTIYTVAMPCTLREQRAFKLAHTIQEPELALDRNHKIVDACDVLIMCPDGPERQRSGTWATYRYAMRAGKPIILIWPKGEVTREQQRLFSDA